ncbi:uncharacterized protein LOC121287515 [Carcharodon carcharias]|uniref:uncharacterized protein LOC121287515 n=1 Tax=Carcharodon carcharias TaxID=13397 RepID=UPI001B7ECE16|nr:uncharacterized protein LOC121287515 [Carcharodon carcharias]
MALKTFAFNTTEMQTSIQPYSWSWNPALCIKGSSTKQLTPSASQSLNSSQEGTSSIEELEISSLEDPSSRLPTPSTAQRHTAWWDLDPERLGFTVQWSLDMCLQQEAGSAKLPSNWRTAGEEASERSESDDEPLDSAFQFIVKRQQKTGKHHAELLQPSWSAFACSLMKFPLNFVFCICSFPQKSLSGDANIAVNTSWLTV